MKHFSHPGYPVILSKIQLLILGLANVSPKYFSKYFPYWLAKEMFLNRLLSPSNYAGA